MISTEADFYEIIEKEGFVDNPDIQEQLLFYAIRHPKFDNLFALWLIQEAYPVNFSFILLEPMIIEVASVDEILRCLKWFRYKPIPFVEIVLNKGTTKQIESLDAILKEVFDE